MSSKDKFKISDDARSAGLAMGAIAVYIVAGYFLHTRSPFFSHSIRVIFLTLVWVVIPLYALLKIGSFLTVPSILVLVHIIVSQQFTFHFGYAIMLLCNCIIKTDIRAKIPLLWTTASSNLVVIPYIILSALCNSNPRLSSSKYCKDASNYSALCCLQQGIFYLFVVYPFLIYNKYSVCYEIEKRAFCIMHYFNTIEDFLGIEVSESDTPTSRITRNLI